MAVRLNKVELQPAAADEDIAWALNEVVTRRSMTQTAALAVLNARLVAKGLETISLSGFNRTVVDCRERGVPMRWRLAEQGRSRPASALPEALLAAIAEVVDARIEHALQRREGRR
jgi:hypothetical protein